MCGIHVQVLKNSTAEKKSPKTDKEMQYLEVALVVVGNREDQNKHVLCLRLRWRHFKEELYIV